MRSWWVVLPLLLAGCMGPDAAPHQPSLLPPSLLVDRSPDDTLQLYVHAKQGNVRYASVNVSVDGALRAARVATYGVEEVLDRSAAEVRVEVVDAGVVYLWEASLALNLTAEPATLRVQSPAATGEEEPPRESALPFEKLLPRAPEESAERDRGDDASAGDAGGSGGAP